MDNITDTLHHYIRLLAQFSWLEWIIFSLIVNVLLFLFSILLFLFIEKTCHKKTLQPTNHPIYKTDFLISLLTIICNAFVMLIGVVLWKNNLIVLNESKSLFSVALECIGLLILMDLFMYIFHYLAHIPFIYKILHRKHHEHTSTNFLSLFVLHPFETLGFGLMMISLFSFYDFSILSIVLYLTINLIWGTIGHLNREFFPSSFDLFFVGTTKFHNQHHLYENKNFGFYTSIWDRIFGTYKA